MRPRKVRVLHDGKEYWLVDTGRGRQSRVLTLIRRVEPVEERPAPLLRTDIGDCVALASWQQGEVAVEEGQEALREPFARIVERYLEEFRVGRPRQGAKSCFFLSVDRQPLFTLHRAQPCGLTVMIWSERKDAKRAAEERQGVDARPIEVEESGDLADFLSARAAEGFAGAVLDDSEPIFFCTDGAGQPRYLKLGLDSESGEIEHSLLADGARWAPYEGDEELSIEIDQDSLDEQMIERLGDIPWLGFHDAIRLYRLRRKSAPEELVVVNCEDEEVEAACPLFHDQELAQAFIADHLLDDCELAPVEELPALLRRAAAEGKNVQLQPEAHRARGGSVWLNGNSLVLDSFSGLWTSSDGGASFVKDDA